MRRIVKNIVNKFGYRISKLNLYQPEDIHFLHIGKAAGSQITHLMKELNKSQNHERFVKCGHQVQLRDLPEKGKYFFSIRNPLDRFVSGFYSRKRKGAPRNYNEWSEFESYSFKCFDHANDLAESLFEEGDRGHQAIAAINSISHTATNQIQWFSRTGAFLYLRPPIHIIRQEHFEFDLTVLMNRIGLERNVTNLIAKSDPIISHANNYHNVPKLSEKAQVNLKRWFVQDVEFYKACEAWIEESKGSHA